jgi:FKBP-type peptidyl-prolyl cis-trans isomerase FkpA
VIATTPRFVINDYTGAFRRNEGPRMPSLKIVSKKMTCTLITGLLACCVLSGCVSKPSFSPGPADSDAPAEFSETESGLKYRVLRKGNGNKPKPSNTVKVHYAGTLDDGTEFDSSYRTGEPVSFGLTQVIPGWTEGLQLVDVGGMIELQIPSKLGYGDQGVPGSIPPGATLYFTVELFEIR